MYVLLSDPHMRTIQLVVLLVRSDLDFIQDFETSLCRGLLFSDGCGPGGPRRQAQTRTRAVPLAAAVQLAA